MIGAVLLLAAARMPVRLHRALAYPLLAGSVFLMCLVQVPGIGEAVNGNPNWISLGGPFQLQPSEFGKLALVLWGADLLARKQRQGPADASGSTCWCRWSRSPCCCSG